MQATQEQIEAWKQKYGEVFMVELEGGKRCYLHRPDRKTLGFASSVGTKNPIRFNEIMLNGCWIDGDEEIKTNDSLFFSASAQLAELIEVQEATLVKL